MLQSGNLISNKKHNCSLFKKQPSRSIVSVATKRADIRNDTPSLARKLLTIAPSNERDIHFITNSYIHEAYSNQKKVNI